MGPLRLLILQATPYCNLNCTYCYLPDKSIRRRMGMDVIEQSVARIAASGLINKSFSVVWHAGEPLAAGLRFYREADAAIRKHLPADITVKHCLQTNGTLINKDWCQLFKDMPISVGVSIDGPAFINDKFRVDRSGKGSLAQIERGVRCLQEAGLSFHTISVVTKDAVAQPDAIFQYLYSLGPDCIAFNVEEIEGVHDTSSLQSVTEEEFGQFMIRMHELSFAVGKPNLVREFQHAHHAIMGSVRRGSRMLAMENNPLSIINVDVDGNFSSFSPELLGMKHPVYGDFILGNFLRSGIEELKESAKFQQMTQEIEAGVKACQATCEYFHFCGGGAPSNKLYENGSFHSAETMHCRMTKKVITNIVLDRMESMLAHDLPEEYAELMA
ncbi:MAG TPA: cyclophane-forming radical SAM/SPASM peptide maturase GrrM/OscB [Oligoflexus sp.]|uniref:cyclophane-forming radical SAM/SPASM peptide maturase GrrM/OscB n=1 Tax=Oligoflexus sp. TaxID=1971216 RepID=UPI002D530090|nr:cyclophane-forming radical SAM/SPASM peptide maturase GrrM/OscB [Oligoflexus sp.]HYX35962.1 cyclophane-forming radical SAM/SPASM peptide maturase GrrM/OscB [Oligoflexus sp.]